MIDRITIGVLVTVIWFSGYGQTTVHFNSVEPVRYGLENRFIVEKNGKFGLADSNMVLLTPIEFDFISNWETPKLRGHIVINNGKQGVITQNGRMIIPTEYDEIIIGLIDYIIVRKGDFYGTITRDNESALPFKYDEILWDSSARDYRMDKIDRLYVKINDEFYQIDFKGNILSETVPKEIVESFRPRFNMEKIWIDPTLKELIIIDVELDDDEFLKLLD